MVATPPIGRKRRVLKTSMNTIERTPRFRPRASRISKASDARRRGAIRRDVLSLDERGAMLSRMSLLVRFGRSSRYYGANATSVLTDPALNFGHAIGERMAITSEEEWAQRVLLRS
jgi:hypothetical protein